MKFRNFTPHPLNVVRLDCPDAIELEDRDEYLIIEIPSECASVKEAPRVEVVEVGEKVIHTDTFSIPIVDTENGEVVRLPAPEEGTVFVVSKITLDGSDRTDLVCVYDTVRNSKGHTLGCRKLSRPVKS